MIQEKPNIVLLLTDQERSHKHWPCGWAENNLTAHYDRLIGCDRLSSGGENRRSSAVFANAFTATTECSPSRASILTSSYPSEHGVVTTPGALDPKTDRGTTTYPSQNAPPLHQMGIRPNLLRLLSSANYDVAWKGKWHLTPPFPTSRNVNPTHPPNVLKWYGATSSWNPPDAGHSLSLSSTLGGGWKYNHDGRFLRGEKGKFDVAMQHLGKKMDGDTENCKMEGIGDHLMKESDESVFEFLAKHSLHDKNDRHQKCNKEDAKLKPFFLVVSLVNPHDVWASSYFSSLSDEEFFKLTGYDPTEFDQLQMDLPHNHCDDLTEKPSIQFIMKTDPVFGDLPDVCYATEQEQQNNLAEKIGERNRPNSRCSDALRYFRFYAYLHKVVDAEIGSLLNALESTGRMENTILIRTSDHGELALSHGMREKRMQCYEETISVPFVINYPLDWFDEAKTESKVSISRTLNRLVSSIDILPTIAELAGVDCSRYDYRGKSLVSFLRDGSIDNAGESDEILFTFDEPLAPDNVPGFIRCIRSATMKYAVYFTVEGDTVEYEMYNLVADPYEMKNLCGPGTEPNEIWLFWHKRLTSLMTKMKAMPTTFDWAERSKPRKWTRL
ncbi:hypothetical protein ACHAXS_011285 [Conticribra weissflogii]